jgi:DNA-binding NtrC family response regulator
MSAPPATRILTTRNGAEVLAVRCARLRVVAGPDTGKEVDLGVRTSVTIGTDPDVQLVLSDDTVSRRHAELRSGAEGYVLRDLGSTNGIRIGSVVLREARLDGETVTFSLGETDIEFALSSVEVEHELSGQDRFGTVLGNAPAMRRMFALLERAAASDTTVLLEGESGTGKEVIAESIHHASPRAKEPLVVVDCSTIPPELFESELFGHERGSFTGANASRAGAFEAADGGTLFLDEIGELPLALQPKFLRALEKRQVKRIGSTHYKDVDVRVVAATNRDLARFSAEGKFRSDLYYRLAVVHVAVPPLRHHPEDIGRLARHFVKRVRPTADPDQLITAAVLAAFTAYTWPGNVRELRNAVERLLALGELAGPLGQPRADQPEPVAPPIDEYHHARREALDRFEAAYCRRLLDECNGVVTHAAERAGISRQTFHRLLKQHGIDAE